MLAPAQRRRLVLLGVRRVMIVVLSLGVAGLVAYAVWPAATPVDMAMVSAGPLVVTVRDEGRTRIRDRYTVSSPLAGRVLRIELDPGDPVVRNETVLATIEPADPALLDARALAQARANVNGAEASRLRASAELERAMAVLERAQSQFRRIKSLRETGTAAVDELEDAELYLRQSVQQHEAARLSVRIAEFELEQAKAALLRFEPASENSAEKAIDQGGRMEVRSPISGQVLRVFQESAAVVTPGTPLVEVGDPKDLEIVVDVLSTEAVKIRAGNRVHIEHWGGEKRLEGRVRTIEPQAFTKVSALGVEEQRVNVIIDFVSPVEDRMNLGDGYRVETDVVVWEDENVLKVPTGALFRRDEAWVVFLVDDGRARVQKVNLGRRNSLEAEVIDGLREGAVVILHPSDEIQEGAKVIPRG